MGSVSLTRNWTPGPLHWECRDLATGLPGKSLLITLICFSLPASEDKHLFICSLAIRISSCGNGQFCCIQLDTMCCVLQAFFPQLSFDFGFVCLCCCLVAKSYLPLCDPKNCSTPGFPVLHCLLEFAQTHVHWANDAIQPSHSLSPPFPSALNLSQNQCLFYWVKRLF